MELDPVVQRLPFKYKCLFFIYTLPGLIYALIVLPLCIANPFWFRQDALNGLERQISRFGQWRNRLMQKHYNKYSMLHIIKDS